jgi:RNA polymerase sigma factor (sigma-70 family)
VPQGNVIFAVERKALSPLPLLCPMPFLPVMVSSAAKRRSEHAMKSAVQTRTESDARRSELMAAAQNGDRVAYETLLRDCVPFIASVARRQGVPSDRIDDVVQEVLLTVHRARSTYDPQRSFEAWLRVIAERRAIDILRQLYRFQVREVHAPLDYENHADETIDVSTVIEHIDEAERVGAAVAELPKRQREAVRHIMLEEKSLGEAAALTGRSKGSLKVTLHRALKALRLKMDRGD